MENRVEELRRTYGIKQEALAEAMGVSRQSIGSIENGRYSPSTALAIKIARFFGLKVEDVFYLEGAPAWRGGEMLSHLPADSLVMRNRAHNLEIPLPGDAPITGQGNRFPSQFAYATFMTAFNGAEPIALYNALYLTDRTMPFADVLTELEGNDLPLLDGYGGTDPRALTPFFASHEVPVTLYEVQADFLAAIREGDVFVLSYWNDRFFRELKGLRTVAGTLRDGTWTVYNMHNDDTAPRTYRTLPETLRGKKFILAYLLHR
jgi:putative transcriptional regulator